MIARSLSLLFAAAILAACFPAQPPEHGPRQVAANGPYTQVASGMVFPDAAGAFRRVDVIEYESSGHNVSASYVLARSYGAVVATAYVYPQPATITCAREFEGVKGAVVELHPAAVLVEERVVPAPHGDPATSGRMAAFTYRDDFFGENRDLQSEAYLFCGVLDRWLVKYRFTAPVDLPVGDAIAAFMAAVPVRSPE